MATKRTSASGSKMLLDVVAPNKTTHDDSIHTELKAAFGWAQMTKAQRELFRSNGWNDAEAVVRNLKTAKQFNFSSFSEQAEKKNFGEYLSRFLASRFSRALSKDFDGILPDSTG